MVLTGLVISCCSVFENFGNEANVVIVGTKVIFVNLERSNVEKWLGVC